ncbi:hypothetical protein JYG23_08065 [Sedimentibacter sp. zth1]|uniref:ADP-ribosyltransferase n=1 Tax=Sedimentibacter sp. zth1 TaxID=2816908 RepID=UPI001A91D04C|nr:ADP-ribosyltransferase [Sedimentibacter sp. zth1]QSX04663.1 hypothetical protein JYG23_08065 [Sedimentibacter sp. zth1]
MNKIIEIFDSIKYGEISCNISYDDYLEFKSNKECKKWGFVHYGEWSKNYKSNMHNMKKIGKSTFVDICLEGYCGYLYKDINIYLRNNDENDILESYKITAHVLAAVLCMAPRIPDNIVVYRLVCDEFIEELIENNKKGIPTLERGFISTSMTLDIVKSEEPYNLHENLLKIYVSKDTIGVYVNSVANRSENEILLYPNGYLRLIKKPYKQLNKIVYECVIIYY